jgi:excisionase family DNA binding protein
MRTGKAEKGIIMIFSKRQSAEKLGISVKTLERKINDGSLPIHKIGKRILIEETDLNAFWQNCRCLKRQLCENGGEHEK